MNKSFKFTVYLCDNDFQSVNPINSIQFLCSNTQARLLLYLSEGINKESVINYNTISSEVNHFHFWTSVRYSWTMWLIPLSIITVITTLVLAFYSSIIQIQYSNVDGYQLRSRTYIFARQISFGFINASIFISALYNWNGSRYFLDNFDSITVFVSLSLSVYSDGVNNIHNELVKSYWLCNYLFILVYFIAQYLWNETLFSLMHMILFALGISFTVLDVLLPNIKMQIEKPSIEYTCGLFDFFTFSYLNKSLIQPNMNKSMEFNDIPSLIDADTTSYCWRQISYRLNDMSLMYNLILSVKYDLLSQFVYELISSLLEVSAPISLQIIISYVNNTNSSSLETVLPFNLSNTGAIIVLFTCSFLRGKFISFIERK